jgi:hypothetical protein
MRGLTCKPDGSQTQELVASMAETRNALDLEPVFKEKIPKKIARSLKASAEHGEGRKSDPNARRCRCPASIASYALIARTSIATGASSLVPARKFLKAFNFTSGLTSLPASAAATYT